MYDSILHASDSIRRAVARKVFIMYEGIVKCVLRQYGYPPDIQKLATETVLRQSEMIADELTLPDVDHAPPFNR
ncbi:MAG: DUF3387 domain-containing protein [Spirochaetes bacterium]|nr:DUF3387 domain-containing protein [Spirochaetota bacterium]